MSPMRVHHPLIPQRRRPMGVSVGGQSFSNFAAAQVYLEREARDHLARCAQRYQQLLREAQ